MLYTYQGNNGHIVIPIDGKTMLVDTGAPTTVYDSYLGVSVKELNVLSGTMFDGILGMDQLSKSALQLTQNSVSIDEPMILNLNEGIEMHDIMSVPTIEVEINGVICTAIFDTGATSTYVSSEVASMDEPMGEIEDFYPMLGKFTSQLYKGELNLAGQCIGMPLGSLPPELSLMLIKMGVSAILGMDILKHNCVTLDFIKNRFYAMNSHAVH